MTALVRDRILDAAATAFTARGYHHTGLEEICSDAGVSKIDLTSEFSDRYDLFATTVLRAARTILRATDHIAHESTDARQARVHILANIEATARVTISQRRSSGFYRSQVRYLSAEHREQHRAIIDEVQERLRRPLAVMRPELDASDIRLLAAAAHSTIASITIHPTTLPEPKMLTLLTTAAMRVLDSRPATLGDIVVGYPTVVLPWQEEVTEQNRAIESAMRLFATHGYDAVTIEDIAETSGVSVSEIERQVGSKYDCMHAGCVIGYSYLRHTNEVMRQLPGGPLAVLAGLCGAYVHHSFSDPEGITVFLSDARHIPGEARDDLLELQSEFLGHWVRTLREARPELSQPEASFLVFAALGIVNDLGRALGWIDTELVKAKISRVVLAAMATVRA